MTSMTGFDIPQELVDMLNTAVGHEHKRQGKVLGCLADILSRYEEMRQSGEYAPPSD
jgi:hypothetical protein